MFLVASLPGSTTLAQTSGGENGELGETDEAGAEAYPELAELATALGVDPNTHTIVLQDFGDLRLVFAAGLTTDELSLAVAGPDGYSAPVRGLSVLDLGSVSEENVLRQFEFCEALEPTLRVEPATGLGQITVSCLFGADILTTRDSTRLFRLPERRVSAPEALETAWSGLGSRYTTSFGLCESDGLVSFTLTAAGQVETETSLSVLWLGPPRPESGFEDEFTEQIWQSCERDRAELAVDLAD